MITRSNACTWTGQKQFAYMRYDPDVTQDGLNALGLNDVKAETVQALDSVKFIKEIQRVGVEFAKHSVSLDHFAGFV